MATGRTIRPGLAIDVPGLRKTCPGGVEAVGGIDFTVQPGEPLRSARPERRRQADDDRDAHDDDRPRRRQAKLAWFDVVREPLAARQVSSVVCQEAVVDRGL